MRRRIPLSPAQSASFSMGRQLICLDSWRCLSDGPVELERAMLIDFALQHPRSVSSLDQGMEVIVRAHGFQDHDLSELFAQRRLGGFREAFLATSAELLSRNLLIEDPAYKAESTGLQITETGSEVASRFTSPLSIFLRSAADLICRAWQRRAIGLLAREIREELPDESGAIAQLESPFGAWLEDVDG
jgi:hypothetical protein